jgi:hypothetical protein
VWLHFVLAKAGEPISADDEGFNPAAIAYFPFREHSAACTARTCPQLGPCRHCRHLATAVLLRPLAPWAPAGLNAYRPKPKNSTGVNLLSDNPADAPKKEKVGARGCEVGGGGKGLGREAGGCEVGARGWRGSEGLRGWRLRLGATSMQLSEPWGPERAACCCQGFRSCGAGVPPPPRGTLRS